MNKSYFGERAWLLQKENLAQKPADMITSPDTAAGDRYTRELLSTLAVPEEFTASATPSAVPCILHAPHSMITLLYLNNCKAYPYKASLLRLIPWSDKTLVLTAFTLICPL